MASRPSCSRPIIPLGRLRGSTCFPDDDDNDDNLNDDDGDDDDEVGDDWEKLSGPPVGQGEGQQPQVVHLPVGPGDLQQQNKICKTKTWSQLTAAKYDLHKKTNLEQRPICRPPFAREVPAPA